MEYKGWALFLDCDMLFTSDIKELWDLRNDDYAVMVCQHDYIPKHLSKFGNQIQTVYEKKNWSSLMLMNTDKCKQLTKEYVDTASGLELHQFKWTDKVDDIEPQQQAATILTDPQGSLTHVHRTDHQGSELLKKIAID